MVQNFQSSTYTHETHVDDVFNILTPFHIELATQLTWSVWMFTRKGNLQFVVTSYSFCISNSDYETWYGNLCEFWMLSGGENEKYDPMAKLVCRVENAHKRASYRQQQWTRRTNQPLVDQITGWSFVTSWKWPVVLEESTECTSQR